MRSMRGRLAVAGIVLALTFVAPISATDDGIPGLGAASAARHSASVSARGPVWPEPATNGRAAVEALGTRLPEVARRQGWTAERLAATLLADPTLHIDRNDRLFFVEAAPTTSGAPSATTAEAPSALAAAPYPMSQTFALHSRPGSSLTILLDFGPRTMSGNAWTASENGGSDIACPAWSLDGDPAFNDAEKTAIQEIWQRVAEDYAPFKVDVTTQFTTEAAITRSSGADTVYGTRVLVSPISSYFGAYGGIAYLSVFNDVGDYYKPALVFPEWLGNNPKSIAEAAAHEAGHNLALSHDGTPSQGYYAGSGSGATGWAPIMGNGYSRNLSQWSKGEYSDANNQEDDLAIIAGYLGYQVDDVGGTPAAATVLPEATTLSASGLVSSSSDVDVFRFSAGAGGATIDVSPAAVGPDLDISAEIRDVGGAVIVASNPADQLTSHLAATVPEGTYYLFVRGTGKGNPLDSGGYSSYASIGRYTVSGTVAALAPDLSTGTLSGTVSASGGGPLPGVAVSVPGTATVTTGADGAYTVAGVTPGVYSATYSKAGYTSQTLGVTIVSGTVTTRDVALVAIPVVLSGTLSGTVAASGGGPLPGVTVSVPGTPNVTTAADGTYTVAGVTPGVYSATYSKAGYMSQTLGVTIVSGTVTERYVALVAIPVVLSGSLSGTVSASGGGPLPGVTVSVPGTANVTTGADGAYTVAGVTPGVYSAVYSKAGYMSQTLSVTIVSGIMTAQDVTLVAIPVVLSGTLSGTASASGGGPLSGVTVSVPGTPNVTTAADGAYTVAGVTPGVYSATYSKAGYMSQTIDVAIVSATTTTQDVTLALVPGTLSGTVTASGGGPLSGVTVSIPGTANVTTAADGTYTVAGVTPGVYSATYSKVGYTSQTIGVTIAVGATTTRDVALDPVAVATLTPVYRFFNKSNGGHFYTASEAEKNSVIAHLSATYALDGVAYKVSSAFGTPLHRFFNKSNGGHFYTASEAEKNDVIANLSATYSYDGIAYKVSATPIAGSTPVYRFFNKSNGGHFYTASEAEKNDVIANLSATYALDGVAFHVVP